MYISDKEWGKIKKCLYIKKLALVAATLSILPLRLILYTRMCIVALRKIWSMKSRWNILVIMLVVVCSLCDSLSI